MIIQNSKEETNPRRQKKLGDEHAHKKQGGLGHGSSGRVPG
jgi:hypothetical protein